MKNLTSKNNSDSNSNSSKPFFNKSKNGTLFSQTEEVETPFISPSTIQSKISRTPQNNLIQRYIPPTEEGVFNEESDDFNREDDFRRRGDPPSYMESLNPPAGYGIRQMNEGEVTNQEQPAEESEQEDNLSEENIRRSIGYNRRRITDQNNIRSIRRLLNLPSRPNIVDEGFVLAVARWQSANEIEPTGRVDGRTRRSMGENLIDSSEEISGRPRLSQQMRVEGESIIVPEDDEVKRKMAAVVLAEAYRGQEEAIAWIYYNRVIDRGVNTGLSGSSAFRLETWHYKVWYTLLGGTGFESDTPSERDLDHHSELTSTTTIRNHIRNGYFTAGAGHSRLILVRTIINNIFSDRGQNPNPGWTGQGNISDFNLDRGKWKKSRHYYWLQRSGVVTDIFVKVLLNSPAQIRHSQFIMNDYSIRDYFRSNRVPSNVPAITSRYLTRLHSQHQTTPVPYVVSV